MVIKADQIFVVDKNSIHRNLIKYHLNVNKFSRVQPFSSGDECLYRIYKNTIPDFIVVDYDPDNFTGFDFIKKVKRAAPQVHIIFFTTNDDPILAVKLLEAGASDYLVKTSKIDFGISELIKNIKFIIRDPVISD